MANHNWLNGWSSHPTGLAVLGEEGDGKTWAVAAWILSAAGFIHAKFVNERKRECRHKTSAMTY